MKKLMLLSFVFFLFCNITFSQPDYQGNLSFRHNMPYNIHVTMECVSIPFEGKHWSSLPEPVNNRNHIIQNGTTYRRYLEPPEDFSYSEMQITKHVFYVISGQPYTTVHCSQNINPSTIKTFGFGKYIITIEYQNNITHKFYFNTLDSKFSDEVNGNTYSNDFVAQYNGPNQNIIFSGNFGQRSIAPYNPNNPITEMNVWDLLLNRSEPVETKFYVSSTPFGYSLKNTQEYCEIYKPIMLIGPHVILDKVDPQDPNDQSVFPYSETTKRGYNTLSWIFQYGTYDYYNNPPIPINQNEPGKTYVTPAILVSYASFMAGTNFIAESGNIFELGANNKFWISSAEFEQMEGVNGDALTLKKNSHLVLGENAKIQTCRMGKFIDEGSIKDFSNGNVIRAWGSTNNGWAFLSEIKFDGENEVHTINNGAKVQIDAFATLTIGNNTTLVFDGQNTSLQVNADAHINLGTNAKIVFQNGAYINAAGSTFSGIGGANWQGLEFIDASSSTISGCTFQNAVLPIKISSNQSSATYNITNNVFTMPSGGTYGIFASNIFSLNLQNNTFNLTNSANGVRINNYYFAVPPNEDDEPIFLINNNTFNGGYVDLLLANFTSSLVPYEILNNKFYNNNYIAILGRMISGNVKNNKGNTGSCQRAFHFTQSNINLYGNTDIYANNGLYAGDATIHLAPTTSEAGMVWLAGKNHIYSNQNDVLSFMNTSVALKDGENFIFKPAGNSYHLYGYIFMNGANNLSARNNCFNQSQSPNSFLWDENYNTIIPNTAGSTINCLSTTDAGIGWIVRDLGFEIYDSVKITSLPSGTQLTNEEMLYSQIVYDFNSASYFNAAAGIKSYINQYPSSSNIYSSLYDLYTCYEGLDTNPSQSSRNILYGNLLTYLNDKINSGLYDDNFNSIAYSLTLCCYENITEYNSALDGYEFISLYHPNPDIRILASWDYAEVQALLNSGAGLTSKNEKMTETQFLKERVRKMEKLIKEDPVKNKVKKSYLKLTKEKEKTMEAALNKFTKTEAQIKMQDIRKEETNLKNRAISNLKNGITYTREERETKQLEDLILISSPKSIENRKSSIDDNIIPENYELSQNYPNPFNPVTSIKYSIPKDGLVTITIYDITGKEMRKLVNQVRKAGYYNISFDASTLSSGIYFYRITAGDFVQTKKMVLIK